MEVGGDLNLRVYVYIYNYCMLYFIHQISFDKKIDLRRIHVYRNFLIFDIAVTISLLHVLFNISYTCTRFD